MRRTKGHSMSRPAPAKIDDIEAAIEVRRHPSARRLTLRVSRTRRAVIVTLPVQCDLDEAGSFLSRNIEWVRERLNSLPDPVRLADGSIVPLRGSPHRIVLRRADMPTVHVEAVDGQLLPQIIVAGPPADAIRQLKAWLVAEARRDLEARVAVHEKRLGVASKRIALRDQSSRWGSCSTTRVLSFSWRLILAPSHVLDYVVAHEVAHLREMNHGPRFWALVKRTLPDFEAAKRWLQVYGLDLHRYAPPESRAAG